MSGSPTDSPSPPRDYGPGPDSAPVAVAIGVVPSLVVLSRGLNIEQDYLCAGVLVYPNWVLTAAHCTYEAAQRWPAETNLYIVTATEKLSEPGPAFSVRAIVPHPQFDPVRLRNDLALLRIDSGKADIGPPVSLDGMPISSRVGEIGTIFGWGISINPAEQRISSRLQLIQATVLDADVCFSPPNYKPRRDSGFFCARSVLRYHDTCSKFGGSPLLLLDEKARIYLAGLVSFSTGCPSDRGKPNIYLDIQTFVPWIKSVLADRSNS